MIHWEKLQHCFLCKTIRPIKQKKHSVYIYYKHTVKDIRSGGSGRWGSDGHLTSKFKFGSDSANEFSFHVCLKSSLTWQRSIPGIQTTWCCCLPGKHRQTHLITHSLTHSRPWAKQRQMQLCRLSQWFNFPHHWTCRSISPKNILENLQEIFNGIN